MHILHLYKDYLPVHGGIEHHIQTLAEAQAAAGHRVTVLVTNPAQLPSREVRNGVEVVRAARLMTVASTPLSLQLPLQLRRMAPDITHLQFPYPVGEVSQLLSGLGRRGKRPFVISYQSDVVKQQGILRVYKPLLQRVLRQTDRILTSSPQYIQSSPFLRPLRAKCTPVPLGIDPEPFATASPLPQVAQRPGPKILFMGRHRYYKGVDTLIEAMSEVEAQLFIGGDGPWREAWEQLTAERNLGAKITFLGSIPPDELPGLYAAADIFCLPSNSRAEAFGIVLLEGMASRLPCVTTELSTGTSFVVQDGKTGLVVPPRDPGALAEALNRLVGDPALRRRMGEAGRQRLLSEFTTEVMLGRVMSVYGEVVIGE